MGNIYSTIRNFGAEMRREAERKEQERFTRKYIGGFAVSDRVTPELALAYRQAAGGIVGVDVTIDTTGEYSNREAPAEGTAWAVVEPHNRNAFDAYWDALEPKLDELQSNSSHANE